MFKGPVLWVALLLSAPALWSAFVTGSMSLTTALVRFLIAVVVAVVMINVLRSVTASYRRAALTRAIEDIREAQAGKKTGSSEPGKTPSA